VEHRLKTKGDIVLVPQPSDDINDPLNWPTWKKALAFMPIIIFTSLTNWTIAGLGVAIPLLIEQFGKDLNSTAQDLNGLCVLMLGVGVQSFLPILLTN